MSCSRVFVLAALLAAPLVPQDPEAGAAGRERFLGRQIAQTMHWTGAPWLLRQTREDEENGSLLREWLAVSSGQAVCDLGCGNGYHTLPLARAVGPGGRIFAVDLQPQMLELLRVRSAREDLTNLEFVTATVDDPRLPPASCDLVLLVDVYHELSHPVRVMAAVRRALRPGGRVVLVEFRAEDETVPIKPEHTMSKAQVVLEMASHGFVMREEFDGLPWQHAMAFVVADPERAQDPRLAPREVLAAFLRAARGGDARVLASFLGPGVTLRDVPTMPEGVCAELRAGPGGDLVAALRTHDGARLAGGRDEVVLRADPDGRWLVAAVRETTPWRPFVAMQTALGAGPAAARCELAHDVGFDGVAWDLEELGAARRAIEAMGGDLASAYVVLDLDATTPALGPALAAIDALAGGPGMLWLALRQARFALRAPDGDEAAVAALRALLERGDARGVEIALYPHHGFWLETMDDALRLCERLPHARLGVCFNLCHFLRDGDDPEPGPVLARCGPRLFAVTVNGATLAGDDWSTLIQPLGVGDFDLRRFLATLDALPFAGPIGLQGFGLSGPPRTHLQASMAAWRAARSSGR